MLLNAYWERNGLRVPVYFAGGLTEKSMLYYDLFTSWTSQSIKQARSETNLFDFAHIKPFDGDANAPGPMVLFATPGMLHAGTS